MVLTAPTHGPTGTTTPALSLADFAAYLNVASTSAMQQPLTAALSKVEALCGPIVGGQASYLLQQSSGANRTIFPMWNMRALALPLQGLSLRSVDALVDPYGLDVTASLTAPDVDWLGAVIVCPYQRRGTWTATATSARDAGQAELLKEAALIIAKAMWEKRRGQAARSTQYDEATGPGAPATAVPRDAHLLMNDLYLVVAG